MFGHLDDPAPPEPTTGALLAVAARAGRRRRRRRRALLAGGLVGVLAVGAVGVSLGRRAVPLAASPSAFAFNALSKVTPGAAVPGSVLTDVVFVNPHRGFALGEHRGHSVLAGTRDGGSSWTVVDASPPVGIAAGALVAPVIDFTDPEHGYLWFAAPVPASAGLLWVTADGGRSWHHPPLPGQVLDVSAIGSDVWALVSECPVDPPEPCPLGLDVSIDAGATWHPAANAGLPAPPSPSGTELARITRARAYVLVGPSAAGCCDGWLGYTADGGQSFVALPVPCPRSDDLGAELAASGTEDLWLLCGGQASAGNQGKALYRSSDGGTTWTLAAAADGLGVTAGAGTPVGQALPLLGYVAPYSVEHSNLAVLSPSDAWLRPSRGTVSETVDGGRSWRPVPDLVASGFGSGAPGNLTFISGTQGWVAELGVGLWRTTDGLHWSPLAVG